MDFLLLRDWKNSDPAGWFLSEKLDGWRCGWDGSRLWTRGGIQLDAPDWFLAGMPSCALDGELFAGRGGFNLIQRRIRDGWRGLTFEVFDAPAASGGFAERFDFLRTLALPSHVGTVEQVVCVGLAHLREFTAGIVRGGGEGAVLRDPAAVWTAGRTASVQRWVPVPPQFNRRAA